MAAALLGRAVGTAFARQAGLATASAAAGLCRSSSAATRTPSAAAAAAATNARRAFAADAAYDINSRTKPHLNIGTIGHVDHGKTTLTAAITKVRVWCADRRRRRAPTGAPARALERAPCFLR
jgi:hypothetical protein